jgi:hypothetical protein
MATRPEIGVLGDFGAGEQMKILPVCQDSWCMVEMTVKRVTC